MERDLPRNGLLSGMVLTYGAAVVAAVIGLFIPPWKAVFVAEASPELLDGFLISVLVLIAHKVESYRHGEYDACPVYLTMGRAPWTANPRQHLFMSAIPALMVMLLILAVVMRGAPWTMLFFLIWAGQGLHEWHHLAKTAASGEYYPGLVTALLFTASVSVLVFPRWVADLGVDRTLWYSVYYGAQPVIFAAFFFEHRRWLAACKAVQAPASE